MSGDVLEEHILGLPSGLDQRSPYNDLLPIVSFEQAPWKPDVPVVGCAPLAIVRLMAHEEMTSSSPLGFAQRIRDLHETARAKGLISYEHPNSSSMGLLAMGRLFEASGFHIHNFKTLLLESQEPDENRRSADAYRYVKAVIDKGHPVLVASRVSASKHAFIIDGYRKTDGLFGGVNLFFHILWGWGEAKDAKWEQIDARFDFFSDVSEYFGGWTETELGNLQFFSASPSPAQDRMVSGGSIGRYISASASESIPISGYGSATNPFLSWGRPDESDSDHLDFVGTPFSLDPESAETIGELVFQNSETLDEAVAVEARLNVRLSLTAAGVPDIDWEIPIEIQPLSGGGQKLIVNPGQWVREIEVGGESYAIKLWASIHPGQVYEVNVPPGTSHTVELWAELTQQPIIAGIVPAFGYTSETSKELTFHGYNLNRVLPGQMFLNTLQASSVASQTATSISGIFDLSAATLGELNAIGIYNTSIGNTPSTMMRAFTVAEMPQIEELFKTYTNGSGQSVSTFELPAIVEGNVRLQSGTLFPFNAGDSVIQGDLIVEGGVLNLEGRTLRVIGNLIQPSGVVRPEGGQLEVLGDYRIETPNGSGGWGVSNGYLRMPSSNPNSSVLIHGDFSTQSSYTGNSADVIMAGTLEVRGDFAQSGNSSNFNPHTSYGFRVLLSGAGPQIVSFEDPGSSHFNILEIANPAVTLPTLVPFYALISNGNALIAPTEGMTAETGVTIRSGETLRINGDLIQTNGYTRIENGRLEVLGDYRIETPDGSGGWGASSGYLRMPSSNPNSYVLVHGDFSTQSSIHGGFADIIEAGTLEVRGDFHQSGAAYNLNPNTSYGFRVLLSGAGPQVISFEDAGASHFNILEVANPAGVTFDSDVPIATLFNHRRNPFILHANHAANDFADWDGDGAKDHIDPYPINPFRDHTSPAGPPLIDTDGDSVLDAATAGNYRYGDWAEFHTEGAGVAVTMTLMQEVLGDIDDDGVPNIVEFLTGTNPLKKSRSPSTPMIMSDPETGERFLAIEFDLVKAAAPELEFYAECSTELSSTSWTRLPFSPQVLSDDGTRQRVCIPDAAPISPVQPIGFMRLVTELPSN